MSKAKAKITKAIRIITLAPIMAVATLVTLYIHDGSIYGGVLNFAAAIFFLGVLPLLAYPLQRFIPGFRGKGREGQRNLAMVFAVGGYILGCIANIFLGGSAILTLVYVEYLISGVLIAVFNKLFKLRASAHACGVAGPAVMLAYLGIPWALLPGAVLYLGALWASLDMKRHTAPQFVGGAIIPMATLLVLHFVF